MKVVTIRSFTLFAWSTAGGLNISSHWAREGHVKDVTEKYYSPIYASL